MNECPEPEGKTWREQGAQDGAPNVGWAGVRGLGPWGWRGAGTGQGTALGAVPLGVTAGGEGRWDRDWVLEEEQGPKGQRHWWETDRRTDSRTTQKT